MKIEEANSWKKSTILLTTLLVAGGTSVAVASASSGSDSANFESPAVLASNVVTSNEQDHSQSPISQKEAVAIAEKFVNGTLKEVEKDRENGEVIYEVEVFANGEKYDIDILAATGEILEVDGNLLLANHDEQVTLTKAEAEKIAVDTTGLDPILQTELEIKNKRYVYEVELALGDDDADIVIDAENGEVLEIDDDLSKAEKIGNQLGESQNNAISVDKVKEAINQYFETEVRITDLDLDRDDGYLLYEVDVVVNGDEYELDIDATNGEIVKVEKD